MSVDRQVQPGLSVPPGSLVSPAGQVYLDKMADRDLLDRQAPRENADQVDHQEKPAHEAQLDHVDNQDHQDQRDNPEKPVVQEMTVARAQMAPRDRQVNVDPPVSGDPLVARERVDDLAVKEQLVRLARQDR